LNLYIRASLNSNINLTYNALNVLPLQFDASDRHKRDMQSKIRQYRHRFLSIKSDWALCLQQAACSSELIVFCVVKPLSVISIVRYTGTAEDNIHKVCATL